LIFLALQAQMLGQELAVARPVLVTSELRVLEQAPVVFVLAVVD